MDPKASADSASAAAGEMTQADSFTVNAAPLGFYWLAQDFYDCHQSYEPKPKGRFSLVPYFLLCHSIELALKSQLLHTKTRNQVKVGHGHALTSCYEALPDDQKTLDRAELAVLQQADAIYKKKGLEYFTLTEFEFPLRLAGKHRLPGLGALDAVATKLVAAAKRTAWQRT